MIENGILNLVKRLGILIGQPVDGENQVLNLVKRLGILIGQPVDD